MFDLNEKSDKFHPVEVLEKIEFSEQEPIISTLLYLVIAQTRGIS